MGSPAYSTPTTIEYCDLVMKGGITSGVVYPLAITELSHKYLFKNIGGTSPGAVAAAITAAAEYGRRKGNPSAYARLAALPKDLGTNNLLLNLFQPTTAAVRIFRVVLAALKAKSTAARIVKAVAAITHQFWGWTVLGILLGAAVPFILYRIYGGSAPVYAVLGALWVLTIGGATVLIAARRGRTQGDDREWLRILFWLQCGQQDLGPHSQIGLMSRFRWQQGRIWTLP